MNILGPDALVFGVDDVEAASGYLTAFGLDPAGDGRFEALDGSAIVVRRRDAGLFSSHLRLGYGGRD